MASLSPETMERISRLKNSEKFSSLSPETQSRINGLTAKNTAPVIEKTVEAREPSAMSSFFRSIMRNSPIERMQTTEYMAENGLPKVNPGESMSQYQKRASQTLQPREKEIASEGTIRQFKYPMEAGIAMSGSIAPIKTAKMLGKFFALDKATTAVGLDPQKIKDPNLRDAADVLKFGIEGGIASKRWIPEPKYDAQIKKYAESHRKVLAPSKGDINRVEIKSGKDLDNSYNLAAKEGLIYKVSPDNKLDTFEARESLKQKSFELNKQVDEAISAEPEARFNLNEIRKVAKSKIRKNTKNDADFKAAAKLVDKEINSAISERGAVVNGKDLNAIKQGMWSKGYDPLNPNSKSTAREIGFVAKDMIEKAYPGQNIKGINAKLGEYLTLDSLLDSAHGRVIQKGKIGRYFAQGAGAVIGAPVPFAGPLVGGYAGGKVSDFLNNPERITSSISKKVGKLKKPPEEQFKPSYSPEIIEPILGLPRPEPLPEYLRQRQDIPKMNIPRGNAVSENPIPMGGFMPKGLPAPLPEYLRQRQDIPPMLIPKGQAESSNPIPVPPTPRSETARYNMKSPRDSVFDLRNQDQLNSPLSQFNPLSKPSIPAFKNTGEALAFGKANKNNKPALRELKRLREESVAKNKALMSKENLTDAEMQEGYNEAVKGQLYREALEEASGKPLGKTLGIAAGLGIALSLSSNAQAMEKTIGQRNNNPINLKAFDKWDGMTGKDKFGHAQFKDLDHGIRAALKNLRNHQKKHPHQTIKQYLSTFAEANGDKEADFIAKRLNVSPNTSLAVIRMEDLIIPMAEFESRMQLKPEDVQRVKKRFKL